MELTRSQLVRPLGLLCQVVCMSVLQSGQSVDEVTPVAFRILCDQIM